MSDSYLFQYENGFQINVFGINQKDARQKAKSFASSWKLKFVGKNIKIQNHVLCATTDKQIELNRINLEKFIQQ